MTVAEENNSPIPLSDDDRRARLTELTDLIEILRPAVQADGGDLVLVSADVETGVVDLMLQGACSTCAISSSTLQVGIDRILKDRLEWVTDVKGGVDESIDSEISRSLGTGSYIPKFDTEVSGDDDGEAEASKN